MEPCYERIPVRTSEQRISPTSYQRRSHVPTQRLVGLKYYYPLADKTTTNRTKALQLLNCATGDVDRVTRRLSNRWLQKRGCHKDGCGLVLHLNRGSSPDLRINEGYA